MSKLSKLTAQRPEANSAGVEVTFTPDGENLFRLTVRRGGSHNDELQKFIEKRTRPFRQAGKTFEQLAPKLQREIVAEGLALYVVTGWNEDDFGEPFSIEAARREMTDTLELLEFVNTQATNAEVFRNAALKDASGN